MKENRRKRWLGRVPKITKYKDLQTLLVKEKENYGIPEDVSVDLESLAKGASLIPFIVGDENSVHSTLHCTSIAKGSCFYKMPESIDIVQMEADGTMLQTTYVDLAVFGGELHVDDKGLATLRKVFSGVGFESGSGENLVVCMRDSGFEFTYEGKTYEAKNGIVQELAGNSATVETETQTNGGTDNE